MPGYCVQYAYFKESDAVSRYICPQCQLLLRDAVQPSCGHRICQSCADELLDKYDPPKCPVPECGEDYHCEDGAYHFPDLFVRREINNLVVSCPFSEFGCKWEGKFDQFYNHQSICSYQKSDLFTFPINASPTQSVNWYELVEPQAPGMQCPFHTLGCSNDSDELKQHLNTNEHYHLEIIADRLQLLTEKLQEHTLGAHSQHTRNINFTAVNVQRREPDPLREGAVLSQLSDEVHNLCADEVPRVRDALLLSMQRRLHIQDEEIDSLKSGVMKLEKEFRSKTSELEDRDFRLSLIENSNHNGSMIWKIPKFSQRKAEVQNGKYTSIFSLPFYSGRYGYKMCLRLYIMGDGIGKGTHLSLFFVIMKGEFDNILQWPFTHKVTFKLINQEGGRDIIDTFQPDPMSSSFEKPKSEMNIANGCPKFVFHEELESEGFIVDDTIFIKCVVDTSTIFHL